MTALQDELYRIEAGFWSSDKEHLSRNLDDQGTYETVVEKAAMKPISGSIVSTRRQYRADAAGSTPNARPEERGRLRQAGSLRANPARTLSSGLETLIS